ncbi:MAG: hypothetical protein IJU48_04680 [Synergistaceae bacterium]|nr:hypothetical protein [Synergistaceae bacterium]
MALDKARTIKDNAKRYCYGSAEEVKEMLFPSPLPPLPFLEKILDEFFPDNSNAMQFAVPGPSSAGKTTLLACLIHAFQEQKGLSGMIVEKTQATLQQLRKAYNSWEQEANSPAREFSNAIECGKIKREFEFEIQRHHAAQAITFCDFPGGWMEAPNYDYTEDLRKAKEKDNKQVIDIVKDARVIIVAINTPYLMEFDGIYKDSRFCAVSGIQWILKGLMARRELNRLILLVPIKCEKYLETPQERRKLHEAVKAAFNQTLNLPNSPLYSGKLAIALLTVQTVGNAVFRRFEFLNGEIGGEIEAEVYKKPNLSRKFSPKNADQPMRYLMSFLLAEFQRQKDNRSLWDTFWDFVLFNNGDLKEVVKEIQKGIESDDEEPDFEIFC